MSLSKYTMQFLKLFEADSKMPLEVLTLNPKSEHRSVLPAKGVTSSCPAASGGADPLLGRRADLCLNTHALSAIEIRG